MANYPNSIYDPREKENMPNVIYDPAKKTVLFVEDFQSVEEEIQAVETDLGVGDPPAPGTIKALLILLENHYNLSNYFEHDITPVELSPFPTVVILALEFEGVIIPANLSATATGGVFALSSAPTVNYDIYCSVQELDAESITVRLTYYNETLRQFVPPPLRGPGVTVSLYPKIGVHVVGYPVIIS